MNDPFNRDWAKESEQEPALPTAFADITVVFDRSGSMESMKQAVIEGFNSQVKKMRESPGDTKWTLVQFDDYSSAAGAKEVFPQTVYESKGERDVPFLTNADFLPRGGTALIDGVCKAIQQVDHRTSGKEAYVKPVMMIVTDGAENSSTEYNRAKLREMVSERMAKGWEFIFLGANQDAFAEAAGYGMGSNLAKYAAGIHIASGGLNLAAGTGSTTPYVATASGMGAAMYSGFVGCAAMVSGAIGSGQLYDFAKGPADPLDFSVKPVPPPDPAVNPIVQVGNYVFGKIAR